MLRLSLFLAVAATAAGQHFIASEWEADQFSVRRSRYNRNLQDPGSPCHPSPCGVSTDCRVNNQGNPICACVTGYIPRGSPVDGCLPPAQFPSSPVILHNRLGGGPAHISAGRATDPCNPSPCGPNTECSTNRDGNPLCRCVPGYTPNPDTITGNWFLSLSPHSLHFCRQDARLSVSLTRTAGWVLSAEQTDVPRSLTHVSPIPAVPVLCAMSTMRAMPSVPASQASYPSLTPSLAVDPSVFRKV